MSTPQQPHDPTEPVASPYAGGPGSDTLGDVVPASAPKRRRTGLVAVAAVGVLGVAGAGVAAAFALSGGGTQPEDVLPGDAIAFVKLDLDPSAGQKLNVYRLAKRFPEASEQLQDEDSLRDDVLRELLSEADLDYDREVKPWLGDRAGVAVLPSGEEEPDVVVALAYTDRGKAEDALEGLDGDQPVEFRFVDDYVLLSDDAAVVERAASAQEHLADEEAFDGAVDALDGDQIALAWGDLGRVWDAVPQELRDQASEAQGLALDPTGQLVLGLSAQSDAVELVGRTVDVRTGLEEQDVLAAGEGGGLAGELPGEALAVFSLAGLDESLTAAYPDVQEALSAFVPDFEAQAESFGIRLPEDVATVVGSETAIAAWGDEAAPEVLLRTRTDDPDGALEVLEKAFEAAGGAEAGVAFEDYVAERDGGLAIGTPGALAADGERLSSREGFTSAVPDHESAGAVLWVSIQDALRLSGAAPSEDTDPLEAFGLTAKGGEDGEFRARLTFR